jgi:hypothetical protein
MFESQLPITPVTPPAVDYAQCGVNANAIAWEQHQHYQSHVDVPSYGYEEYLTDIDQSAFGPEEFDVQALLTKMEMQVQNQMPMDFGGNFGVDTSMPMEVPMYF